MKRNSHFILFSLWSSELTMYTTWKLKQILLHITKSPWSYPQVCYKILVKLHHRVILAQDYLGRDFTASFWISQKLLFWQNLCVSLIYIPKFSTQKWKKLKYEKWKKMFLRFEKMFFEYEKILVECNTWRSWPVLRVLCVEAAPSSRPVSMLTMSWTMTASLVRKHFSTSLLSSSHRQVISELGNRRSHSPMIIVIYLYLLFISLLEIGTEVHKLSPYRKA